MRKILKKMNKTRFPFTGIFVRFGTKTGWTGKDEKTVLLKDIKNSSGEKVTDHLWFNYVKGMQILNLTEGDILSFEARVSEYQKGYKGYREDIPRNLEIDYKLSYPNKITILKKV